MELEVTTIDLMTRKLVMKPVWTPLVVRPVNFHVSRDHVMDIFLGKIIMYVIRSQRVPGGFKGSHGVQVVPGDSMRSQGIPRGPKGSQGVPKGTKGLKGPKGLKVKGSQEV